MLPWECKANICFDMVDQNLAATDRVLHTSLETKETIVEGLATLYAVDQNDDKQALKLGKSLTQLPEVRKKDK